MYYVQSLSMDFLLIKELVLRVWGLDSEIWPLKTKIYIIEKILGNKLPSTFLPIWKQKLYIYIFIWGNSDIYK